MRLSMRFTLGLIAASIILFGGQAIVLLEKEGDDLERAAKAEIRLLGRGLGAAVENALRDRQLDDISETVARLDTVDPATDVAVFGVDGSRYAASEGYNATFGIEENRVQAVLVSREPVMDLMAIEGEAGRLVHALPLADDNGRPLGVIVVTRPLTALAQDLDQTRLGFLLPQLLFVVCAIGVGALFGAQYVGKPLRRLVSAIQRVRAGDLSELRVDVRGREFGAIAKELAGMVDELRETRQRLNAQAEAQRETERQLRDADKLISLGQLAAGLAHEIGSPLQVLSGRATALANQIGDPIRAKRHIESIVTESRRIAEIVHDLLNLVRRHGRRSEIELGEVTRAVVGLLEFEARRLSVGLVLAPPQRPVQIHADPGQMRQIVLNLVRNALQTARPGDVVRVRVRAEPDAALLVVEDDGPGVPAEDQERIFEPFFTTRSEQGGTGLGLAVVKSLVSEHGGTVSVRSELGHGATFEVRLPLTAWGGRERGEEAGS